MSVYLDYEMYLILQTLKRKNFETLSLQLVPSYFFCHLVFDYSLQIKVHFHFNIGDYCIHLLPSDMESGWLRYLHPAIITYVHFTLRLNPGPWPSVSGENGCELTGSFPSGREGSSRRHVPGGGGGATDRPAVAPGGQLPGHQCRRTHPHHAHPHSHHPQEHRTNVCW